MGPLVNRTLKFLLVVFFVTLANHTHAQGIKQYQRQFSIGGRLPSVILLIGWEKDAPDIEKLFNMVVAKANESYARLDWQNPSGEVTRINANAGKGAVGVSDDVLAAFQAAHKISGWTTGAFDITYAGGGDWRGIKIRGGSPSIELKSAGMQVRFDPLVEGFMAELLTRYIHAANMQNAIVKVGNVFRGIGYGLYGPWKIQVQDDAGTFARHALNLTINNTAVATVSASEYRYQQLINPRSKEPIAAPCRGVSIVMNDATLAGGIAHAVFVLGPEEGFALLSRMGNAKGLIVDNAGKFIRTPGF